MSAKKKSSILQDKIQSLFDAASGAIGSNRTLALVFAVHIVVLVLVLFGAALFAPRPEVIKPVPVVLEPPAPPAAAEPRKEPVAPEPEKIVTPLPAPPEPEDEIVEPKEKPKPKPKPEPKKVVKKKKKIITPPPKEIKTDENLKERLKSSLKQAKAEPSPAAAPVSSSKPSASEASSSNAAVNVAGSFPYNWYLGLVQSKIGANWDKPEGIMLSDSSVSCVASFSIRRDGKVMSVSIARSSGNSILDQSALDAIRACDPMPPLPERFQGDQIDIKINFNLVK